MSSEDGHEQAVSAPREDVPLTDKDSSIIPGAESLKPELPEGILLQDAIIGEEGIKIAKNHCCLYCNKMYHQMARHLTQCHSNEIDVAKVLLALKKGSKARRIRFSQILHKGDFAHNHQVIEKNHGVLIPKYRFKEKK